MKKRLITKSSDDRHKTASRPQTDSSIVFARWRQCVGPCGHIGATWEYDWTCASFGPPESTTQTANRSVQPLLHSSRQKVSILYNGRPFSPIFPLLMGVWTPSNSWFLGPFWAHNPNGVKSVQAFSHRWPQSVPIFYNGILQWDAPFPSKLPLRICRDLDPIKHMIPWANPSPQRKRHLDRFSRFCRAH